MITKERLHDRLEYNPDTGIFTWKQRTGRTKNLHKAGGISCGYIRIKVDGRSYMAHRIAWVMTYGTWPIEVDHINGVKHDNRLSNLRNVEHVINGKNTKTHKNNTSGTSGVTWSKLHEKWRSRITIDGSYVSLGLFESLEEAVYARKLAEVDYGYHPNHGRAA